MYVSYPIRYRPPKVNKEELKSVVLKFMTHQDYSRAVKEFEELDGVKKYFSMKNKHQLQLLKEHVSVISCNSSMTAI